MEIVELSLNQITISSYNTRKDLLSGTDEINLDDLAHSIQEFGLLSPLIVTKKQDKHEIIPGQRRFLACQNINLQSIPCIVKELVRLLNRKIKTSRNMKAKIIF